MLDIDNLRQWIGQEEVKSELLTPAIVDRFKATFNQYGMAANGAAAPLLIHLCLTASAAPSSDLGPDGHPARGSFLPPVPLPRRMWAGGNFTFHHDIRVGEVVERRSTIHDVAVKDGRSGTLCFVTVNHEITSNDRPVVTERQDIVYRGEDAPGAAKKALPPAPHGAYREQINPSAALLFRYSALTFNGHRIHYDAPYVREVEGYPGLIVHGPLQATLLAQLAEKLRGKRPAQFHFRSLSPLFDDADFIVNAEDDGEGLKLWTSYVDGPVAMEAQAVW